METTTSTARPTARIDKMIALLRAWEQEITRHPVGCVELHFSAQQVKAALKISLGQKQ